LCVARAGEDSVGSKRKSESSATESESKRACDSTEGKQASLETSLGANPGKQATLETSRDQLAEICAASEALKREEAAAQAAAQAEAAQAVAAEAEAEAADDVPTEEEVGKMKVPELRKEASRLGLITTGNKAALQERLTEFIAIVRVQPRGAVPGPPTRTARTQGGPHPQLALRSSHPPIGLYKILFYGEAYVHESVRFFANTTFVWGPHSPSSSHTRLRNILFPLAPPLYCDIYHTLL